MSEVRFELEFEQLTSNYDGFLYWKIFKIEGCSFVKAIAFDMEAENSPEILDCERIQTRLSECILLAIYSWLFRFCKHSNGNHLFFDLSHYVIDCLFFFFEGWKAFPSFYGYLVPLKLHSFVWEKFIHQFKWRWGNALIVSGHINFFFLKIVSIWK